MLSFLKRDKDEPIKDGGDGSWAARLRRGLAATRSRLGDQLAVVFGSGRKVDEQLFEDLEAVLLSCDVGVEATHHLLDQTRARAQRERLQDATQIRDALRQTLLELRAPLAVLLAAGDTFRAAAHEQLKIWGERSDVVVIAQDGGDTAAVIFDAVQSALSKGIDVVIADTAGRLPTQPHLMEEIRKVKRVLAKVIPEAPHEVLLVLDANTGQNAVAQVKAFDQALGVSGIILTKLDGTAKGGAIAAIARHKPIPLRFVGVGEGMDDLRPFSAEQFVQALFE